MKIMDEHATAGTVYSPLGEVEQEIVELEGKSDDDKLNYLLDRAKLSEREDQRDDDIQRDHGIRLYSRQKNQSLGRILMTLFLLTVIYGVQLVALYNLNRASTIIDSNTIVKWLERGDWGTESPLIVVNDTRNLPDQVRLVVGGSEMDLLDMQSKGFCLTRKGGVDLFFNIGNGLIIVYLFLFFDMWFVIFDMPLTRNWIHEKHGAVMLLGEVWLVLMNAAVITWLGVISGFSVLANSADFYSVLFTSLQLFIILVIDDAVLPAIRFFVEENGRLDTFGNLRDNFLMQLTHGSQYYKPGYGHSIARNLRTDPSAVHRAIALLSIFLLSTIISAPLIVTIAYAATTFRQC